MSNVTDKGDAVNVAAAALFSEIKSRLDESVVSVDIRRIVKVTEANYPANPDTETLYVVVEG